VAPGELESGTETMPRRGRTSITRPAHPSLLRALVLGGDTKVTVVPHLRQANVSK
jgi:hypothetical protein